MRRTPKIIVLDDDPTGSQTVHSCLLLTRWDEQAIADALADDAPLFFVLTNTRSMSPPAAAETTRSVCRSIGRALERFGEPWLVVSRSDSTLRGHYPVETDVIGQELGPFDAHFLIPAFFEGGRVTKDATHYVIRDGIEVPAHETEFARDSVFGYSTAFLPDYVEEKTGGRIRSAEVKRFDPVEPESDVLQRLRGLSGNACCVVSASRQEELDRFARLVLRAGAEGKRFLFRSAASVLTSFAGLPEQPVAPESMAEYVPEGRPGLVLVGSHVPTTTAQLEHLLAEYDRVGGPPDAGERTRGSTGRRLFALELDVEALPDTDGAVGASLARRIAEAHRQGADVVLYTSRHERQFNSAAERLAFGTEVSRVLMRIVGDAPPTLGFILSKGGITSNDVLSTGLQLRTARVVGQIYPGCSVVMTPASHRFGSIPVVIFPGNVGDRSSMTVVYRRLTATR